MGDPAGSEDDGRWVVALNLVALDLVALDLVALDLVALDLVALASRRAEGLDLSVAKHSFDLPFERPRPADGATPKDGTGAGDEAGAPVPAVVLKAVLPDDPSEVFPDIEPTEEIRSLAGTAGLEVVGEILQRRRSPHPGSYAGRGKVDEVRELAHQLEADIILVDDPITPGQGKNLEDRTGCRVIDRAELIMDIFATRARTHQAKLQVELAQLRYSQSRLKRMWTHLSRFEGGIGMRGPGETQLETDRRIIRRKIGQLKSKLREIERQHETQNKARVDAFKVALVGYTNAGKSTLMRRLTGAPVLVENRLFSTLDTSTRRWNLEVAQDVLLSDTVGFIRKLPHTLVASFHATLLEAREADLLLHVVDGSSSRVEQDLEVVEETLDRVGCGENRRIIVFNKVDQLGEDRWIDIRHLLAENEGSLNVSAVTGTGIEDLTERVLDLAQAREILVELRLPHARGDLAHRLRSLGTILDETYEEDGIHLRAQLTPEACSHFEQLLERAGLNGADRDLAGLSGTGVSGAGHSGPARNDAELDDAEPGQPSGTAAADGT